ARPDSPLEKQIEFARELGLDMIDFHLGGFPRDHEGMTRIKQLCLKHGMPIGYLGSGGGYGGTDEEIAKAVERDKADVDTAAFMGAPMIRLMSGRPRLDDPDPESTWSRGAAAFQKVADYAAEKGIFVGLQNHPPPAAPRGEDIIRMLKMVDRPNATHIMDTGQWWGSIGADPRGQFDPDVDIYEYMTLTAPYASSVRAKIYKIDTGRELWLDHERIVGILKNVGYNGALCICFEGQGNKLSNDECMKLAVAHLRDILARVYA
ncbi:MAG: TIM barrel protein, partial [Chloroflexi bacterium]|nr:TIM barrel protein [Chloroflexota bacterium]